FFFQAEYGIRAFHLTGVQTCALPISLAELCELVAGTAPFDLAESDEYIEGAVASLDRRLLRRLRRGEYAIQGHLDLHGYSRKEEIGRASGRERVKSARGSVQCTQNTI